MKKIAVCMYGYPRYFKENITLQKHMYNDCEVDFYCHFWYESLDKRNIEEEQYIKKVLNSNNIFFEEQKIFKEVFDFPCDTTKTRNIQSTISPMYSMKKAGELLKEKVIKTNIKYDYVVCTRTDAVCLNIELNDYIKDENIIYSSYVNGKEWIIEENGNLLDTKLIASSYNNILYFLNIYDYYEKYMKDDKIPLCHHHLFCHHFKKINCNFKLLISNQWYFYRKNGLSSA
jgi:hypothetical protein